MPGSQWDGTERRKTSREEFVKAVVCAIREEVRHVGGVEEEKHLEQHKFIEEWLEELKIKRIRREKIKTQVMGWGIVSLLGAIGTGAVHAFIYLREHLK